MSVHQRYEILTAEACFACKKTLQQGQSPEYRLPWQPLLNFTLCNFGLKSYKIILLTSVQLALRTLSSVISDQFNWYMYYWVLDVLCILTKPSCWQTNLFAILSVFYQGDFAIASFPDNLTSHISIQRHFLLGLELIKVFFECKQVMFRNDAKNSGTRKAYGSLFPKVMK